MKRELVKSLRTVALLAIFSQDSNTVVNIQSCLKSMSVMEPDLILHPILERAVPSLEALVEVCGFVDENGSPAPHKPWGISRPSGLLLSLKHWERSHQQLYLVKCTIRVQNILFQYLNFSFQGLTS